MSVCILDLVIRLAEGMHRYFVVTWDPFGCTILLTLRNKHRDFREHIIKLLALELLFFLNFSTPCIKM